MYYALFIVWHKSNKPLVLLEMPNPLLKRKYKVISIEVEK